MADRLFTRDDLIGILTDLRKTCFSEQMAETAQDLLRTLEHEKKYRKVERQESQGVAEMVKYIATHSEEPLEHIRSYVEVSPEARKAFLFARIATNCRFLESQTGTFSIECDDSPSVVLLLLLRSYLDKLSR